MDDRIEISILSEEESLGGLDVLKKFGVHAPGTDLAKLGGSLTDRVAEVQRKDANVAYRTKSLVADSELLLSISANVNQESVYTTHNYYDDSQYGIRPVLRFHDPDLFEQVIQNCRQGVNGTYEVTFGSYPQFAFDQQTQRYLETKRKSLEKTGEGFTLNNPETFRSEEGNYERRYVANNEYVFNDEQGIKRKAVRYQAYPEAQGKYYELSNNETYYTDGTTPLFVWLNVEPITWLIDEKTCSLVSKNVILSNIRFTNNGHYNGNFEETNLQQFLTEIMLPELLRSESLVLSQEGPSR